MKKYNIISLKKQMSVMFAMNFFMKNLNAKDALFCAALPASKGFILLITTTATCTYWYALVYTSIY